MPIATLDTFSMLRGTTAHITAPALAPGKAASAYVVDVGCLAYWTIKPQRSPRTIKI